MKCRTYIASSLCGMLITLLVVGAVVYHVDPYLQYHALRDEFAYKMDMGDFSYYNAGIAKNFSYDTIITGSSMSRAFLTSYIDRKFSCCSVKLSMAEARGKDFSILLPVVEQSPDLHRVIIGLDTFAYNVDKDFSAYEKPMYLYDNNPLNDVLYLTNMNGLLETLDVLQYTADGGTTTSMDDYQNYTLNNTFSREKVVAIYNDYVPVVKTCEFDVVSLEKISGREFGTKFDSNHREKSAG